MWKRLVAMTIIGLGAGILICEVQGLQCLAAVDVEDAERAPTVVRRIADTALADSPNGLYSDATVVVMVWVDGQYTSYQMDIAADPDAPCNFMDDPLCAAIEGDGFLAPPIATPVMP
ncbi:MAG TPA: hypothetical protein QGH10_26375 [Armatimonadota bacterium]|jgi:hypothetical protein|nr:hypothetical protein [Armatimonadota bacterium]